MAALFTADLISFTATWQCGERQQRATNTGNNTRQETTKAERNKVFDVMATTINCGTMSRIIQGNRRNFDNPSQWQPEQCVTRQKSKGQQRTTGATGVEGNKTTGAMATTNTRGDMSRVKQCKRREGTTQNSGNRSSEKLGNRLEGINPAQGMVRFFYCPRGII